MPSSTHSLNFVRQLLLSRAAIVLQTDKDYLIESRLLSVARKHAFKDIDELVMRMRDVGGKELEVEVVDALTTNETYFFRDVTPFDTLAKDVLPSLMRARKIKRRLQIWCAASSTGQEPYSLAMQIREQLPELTQWRLHLLATDISPSCLERAETGIYRPAEVKRGLPAKYLARHFTRVGTDYQLAEGIRKMIEFRHLNLIGDWPSDIKPDLVMMRNVLIYFDPAMKQKVLQKVRQVMAPDGYLMLGAAETTINLDANFERVFPGTYQLRNAGQQAIRGTG